MPADRSHTRRAFLTRSGLAFGSLSLGARTLSAAQVGLRSANAFLRDPARSDYFKTLAARALEAAEHAGASYADIRLAQRHQLSIFLANGMPVVSLETTVSYGIRTMVNGAMAFAYGNAPTVDAVVAVTRHAVTQARGFSALSGQHEDLAPAPVVQGEWASPCEIDPFAVPIMEQGDLMAALGAPTGRIEGAGCQSDFTWERETRVCATSEGSCTTQIFQRARPGFSISATWLGSVGLAMPEFRPRLAGYEMMTNPMLPDRIKAFAEQMKMYAMLPARPMEVGRYPIVLDGSAMATMLIQTLGPALQMDRVLGEEADASGMSFLSPQDGILGVPLFSSQLSVVSDRPLTSLSGARWDDECVLPETSPVIVNGCVVDYLTDRRTSTALAPWYHQHGKPLRSRGYATADHAGRPLIVGAGHLTMAPSTSPMSVEDLCQDMKRGLLMVQGGHVNTDQQLASGLVTAGRCLLLEVKNGKIIGRVHRAALQFKTRSFWKGLEVLGDVHTVAGTTTQLSKGQPWQAGYADGSAPAGRFTSIDVISLGGR
jgi:TldD protein